MLELRQQELEQRADEISLILKTFKNTDPTNKGISKMLQL